ncbi:MerR family transcriptional regulator [Scatolibacter rhodanostii]|uniref:MerR family transcriptional regulator n=1 Tax=Scatolibacter rhodanostii TaxID=2014781 RepID=UPI000C06A14A|nr:MerR family transcriptional regulator [Scatolibacter rhodanostii]
MLVHEVSKITGLTKKAIEYYTQKGLLTPPILENGYRNFSSDDVEKLNKISVLRKLDATIQEFTIF